MRHRLADTVGLTVATLATAAVTIAGVLERLAGAVYRRLCR